MRLHLIAFPHTRIGDPGFSTCAYTAKIEKFAKMEWDELFVYATEGSTIAGGELVECLSDKAREGIFGKNNPKIPPKWPTDEEWAPFNLAASAEVAKRAQPGDLLLLAGGWSQKAVADGNTSLIPCEPGVGYEGIYTDFVAFESYAWQHFIYGKRGMDGRWFDRVIPNYFDVSEFTYRSRPNDNEYLLYVGRVIQRKGLQAAVDLAKACKMPLKVAGPGVQKFRKGKYIQAEELTVKGNLEYLGVLDPEARSEAMGGAVALLAPTVYVEPFGGVAVESMLTGTPVVTTDWGAFTETVQPGRTGYRFRTLQEGVDAVAQARNLSRAGVRDFAARKYSLEAIQPQFRNWFESLETLKGLGWYELS